MQLIGPEDKKLPFPTKTLQIGGRTVEEYLIPEDKKAEVLEQLYIFEDVPSLEEERYDLHEGKKFRVGDYRVTWEHGQNWLMSPYYESSGGSVIDWMPADFGRKSQRKAAKAQRRKGG
ncbi:MAG: hypothetical protein HY318_09350 [Armatimonadetes bacterium]|nr:hypothetical protein [Armatimonadota bacterium]